MALRFTVYSASMATNLAGAAGVSRFLHEFPTRSRILQHSPSQRPNPNYSDIRSRLTPDFSKSTTSFSQKTPAGRDQSPGYSVRGGQLIFRRLFGSNGTPSMSITGFLPLSAGNRRHKSSLVGASETSLSTSYPKSFCEWLAGIIDGDGSIQVSKKGYTDLEITTGLEDLHLLRYIQNMFGGGIKMRAGAKSYRYRLHDRLGMVKLLNCINGQIRHSSRLLQLHRVCQVMEIPVILPLPLEAQSNWFAGFFDADGAICIAMEDELPQLSVRVTNKLLQDVESYKAVFGGSLHFDSSRNGYYQWSIQSREDVIRMLAYFKSSTFRSHKSRRFFLVKEYYSLYDLQAFKPDSIHHKVWLAFLDKWNKLAIQVEERSTLKSTSSFYRDPVS